MIPDKIIETPAENVKLDRETAFEKMVEKAEEKPVQEEIKLPFKILGFSAERKILAWFKGSLMFFTVSQLRADELSLFIEYTDDKHKEQVKNKIKQMVDAYIAVVNERAPNAIPPHMVAPIKMEAAAAI